MRGLLRGSDGLQVDAEKADLLLKVLAVDVEKACSLGNIAAGLDERGHDNASLELMLGVLERHERDGPGLLAELLVLKDIFRKVFTPDDGTGRKGDSILDRVLEFPHVPGKMDRFISACMASLAMVLMFFSAAFPGASR